MSVDASVLSRCLTDVKAELRRSLGSTADRKRARGEDRPAATAGGTDGLLGAVLEEVGPLGSLTAEDWDVVMHPIGELLPYLTVTAPPGGGSGTHGSPSGRPAPVVANYVKCRAAELPMRLTTEALQLRRHEQMLRQHMKELVQLSEFLAFADRTRPAVVVDAETVGPRARSRMEADKTATAAPLTGLDLLASPAEAKRRVARVEERVAELEAAIRQRTVEKTRCAERMVLMSAMTRLLLQMLLPEKAAVKS